LSDKGKAQVNELSEKIKTKNISKIYHSTLKRAVQTARILSEKTKIPTFPLPDIKERNQYGILTGLTKEDAKKRFPDEVKALKARTHLTNVKGSETYDNFRTRILVAFKKTISENTQDYAILTHGGPIRCIMRELYKKEISDIEDCAIIEIKV
jgi:probable phosphoglycerate mutase